MVNLDNLRRRRRDAQINAIFLEQHGAISRAQALAAGADDQRIYYLLGRERWKKLYQTVYRHASHPKTFEQRAVAACLAARKYGIAVASGLTAARVHGLDGAVLARHRRGGGSRREGAGEAELVPIIQEGALGQRRATEARGEPLDGEESIQVTAAKRARIRGVKVFVEPHLCEDDVTVARGVPVMTVARTVVDLARRCPRWRAERALDDALRRELTSMAEVQAAGERMRRFGHRRLKMLGRILAARAPEDSRTESRLEQRVLRCLRRAGLPMPVAQHPVPVGERTLHIDLAYPEARLGIEVDGFEFHRGRRAFDIDRRRANELLLAGWTILRVTSDMRGEEIAGVVGRSLRDASLSSSRQLVPNTQG